jgi:CRP/FNR family transcriptional regulator
LDSDSPSVKTLFPELARSRDKIVAQVLAAAHRVKLPAGAVVFHVGSACEKFLLVIEGSVRVQLLTDSGHEAVLYRVHAGESCILTTSCLLGGVSYPADGITETAVVALAIDSAEFKRALEESPEFRKFVFKRIGERFANVIGHLSEIAFGAIDRRLAETLLQGLQTSGMVALTHQALATELGTAREVVSRHLKRFEHKGWVRLGRSRIEVLAEPELRRLAESGDGHAIAGTPGVKT